MPDAKKPLHGNTPPNLQSTYRALVFALDNVDPMRDGALYCCEYELTGKGDGCCAVHFERLGASDPVGNALPTTGNPEKLCLATGVAPRGGRRRRRRPCRRPRPPRAADAGCGCC